VTKATQKDTAITLRKQGYSYNLIAEKISVSKSTLSVWLADIPYTPNQKTISRIGKARAAASTTRHKQKLESLKEAKRLAVMDVKDVTVREFFMFGLALYIAEGEKNDNVGIINADPEIIIAAIHWFETYYKVPRENFRLAIHLYPDNNRPASLHYWSKTTNIPLSQFGKTQIDRREGKKRSKLGKLPYGTAHLRVLAAGNSAYGVLLARRIKAAARLVLHDASAGVV
jgi:hypothetical protein